CTCNTKEIGAGNDGENIDDGIDSDCASYNTRGQDVTLKVLEQDEKTKCEQSCRPSLCEGEKNNRCSADIDAEKGNELEDKRENTQEKGIGNADKRDSNPGHHAKNGGKRHCPTNIPTNDTLHRIEQKIDLFALTHWGFLPEPLRDLRPSKKKID